MLPGTRTPGMAASQQKGPGTACRRTPSLAAPQTIAILRVKAKGRRKHRRRARCVYIPVSSCRLRVVWNNLSRLGQTGSRRSRGRSGALQCSSVRARCKQARIIVRRNGQPSKNYSGERARRREGSEWMRDKWQAEEQLQAFVSPHSPVAAAPSPAYQLRPIHHNSGGTRPSLQRQRSGADSLYEVRGKV